MNKTIKFLYATLIITIIGSMFTSWFMKQAQNQALASGEGDTAFHDTLQSKKLVAKATEYMERECTRSIPEPVINKKIFPNTTFNLEGYKIEDSNNYLLTGVEKFRLENGDIVTVINSGCEAYGLTFNFETSHFNGDVTDTTYWFKASASLMNQASKGIDPNVPVELNKGIKYLSDISSSQNKKDHQALEYNKYMTYSDNEIPTTIEVKKVEKLPNGNYEVEVTFSVGPL